MTLDNFYRCVSVDPSGLATMQCEGGSGTLEIKGDGIVSVKAGQTYHIHVVVDLWHSQHQVKISEQT